MAMVIVGLSWFTFEEFVLISVLKVRKYRLDTYMYCRLSHVGTISEQVYSVEAERLSCTLSYASF